MAYDGVGELAGDAPDGVTVLLDEAAEVLGGLELFAVEDRVVAVEDVAVVGGEDDFGGDGDKIAGGLAGGGVVGEGGDGLGKDGAAEGGVGVGGFGGVGVEDLVVGAGVELADDGLGEVHLGAVGLGLCGKDGDRKSADVRWDVGGRAGLMVAASGEGSKEKEREGAEVHAAFSIVALEGICPENSDVVEPCFC